MHSDDKHKRANTAKQIWKSLNHKTNMSVKKERQLSVTPKYTYRRL